MLDLPYPVYCPKWAEVAGLDWNIGPRTDNLELVLDSPFRVAAFPVMCNSSHDHSYNIEATKINFNQFDLVLLSDIEFKSIAEITMWCQSNGIKNYLLALGGLHHNETLDPNCMVYRPWWAYNLLKFNQYHDTGYGGKPYHFDALLGARRPHRDYTMLSLQKTGLIDSSIVTYRDVFQGGIIDFWSTQMSWKFNGAKLLHPYISPNLNPLWEPQEKIDHTISPYLPYAIYQQCNYSIVCETLGVSNTFFFSEKTTKPLLAKRLFVIFSSANYLKNLQNFGFKTFNSVIDESYDQVDDHFERFKLAFDQIQWLAKQDSIEIYKAIEPVLTHNHNRIQTLKVDTLTRMHKLLRNNIPTIN